MFHLNFEEDLYIALVVSIFYLSSSNPLIKFLAYQFLGKISQHFVKLLPLLRRIVPYVTLQKPDKIYHRCNIKQICHHWPHHHSDGLFHEANIVLWIILIMISTCEAHIVISSNIWFLFFPVIQDSYFVFSFFLMYTKNSNMWPIFSHS